MISECENRRYTAYPSKKDILRGSLFGMVLLMASNAFAMEGGLKGAIKRDDWELSGHLIIQQPHPTSHMPNFEHSKKRRKDPKQEISKAKKKVKHQDNRMEKAQKIIVTLLPKKEQALEELIKDTSLNKEEGWRLVHEYRKKRMSLEGALQILTPNQNERNSLQALSKQNLLKECSEIDRSLCTANWKVENAKKHKENKTRKLKQLIKKNK